MDKTFLEGGDFNKFIVLKVEDVYKHLDFNQRRSLDGSCRSIAYHREKSGKKPDNTYLVINTDEPYAPEIVEILKRNGHWG